MPPVTGEMGVTGIVTDHVLHMTQEDEAKARSYLDEQEFGFGGNMLFSCQTNHPNETNVAKTTMVKFVAVDLCLLLDDEGMQAAQDVLVRVKAGNLVGARAMLINSGKKDWVIYQPVNPNWADRFHPAMLVPVAV